MYPSRPLPVGRRDSQRPIHDQDEETGGIQYQQGLAIRKMNWMLGNLVFIYEVPSSP